MSIERESPEGVEPAIAGVLGWIALAFALPISLWLVAHGQSELKRQLIDSYYYFEAAKGFGETGLPTIGWPQGPVNKFFPGYPAALALWSAITRQAPHESWAGLNLLLIVLFALLVRRLYALWGFSPGLAGVGAALAVGNLILMRWAAVPYSELLCVTLVVGQAVIVFGGARFLPDWGRALALALLGAIAMATRIEACLFQPLLLVADRSHHRLYWGRPLRIAGGALLAATPLAAWVAWVAAQEGSLHYTHEAVSEFAFNTQWRAFITLVNTSVGYGQFSSVNFGVYLITKVMIWLFVAGLLFALRGGIGKRAFRAAWVLFGYWLIHGLWYYNSERYNVHVVPLIALVLLHAILWIVRPESPVMAHHTRRGAIAFWAIVFTVILAQSRSYYVIENHFFFINREGLSDEAYAKIAELLPTQGGVATDTGVGLAYWHRGGEVWQMRSFAGFYRGLIDEQTPPDVAGLLRQHGIVFLVLTKEIAKYPELEGLGEGEPLAVELGVALRPRFDVEGTLLYEVVGGR